ncbi:MAG: hypothetical protein C4522_01695 [Desulfobacteraceae bacterium]|nr:MAG: hypothetical protein C4522_01695 [Desulfobacteraceae bacterium]
MTLTSKSSIMVTILIMAFLISCTIYKTPRVEDALYKNFEYEFAFRVPTGWDIQESLPKSLGEGLAGLFTNDFRVMLIHPQNNGMIIVQADTSGEDILSLGYNKDAFRERLTARIQAKEQEIAASGQLENYTYEIGPLTVKQGYGPSFIYQESAKNRNGEQYVRSEYLNQCRKKCSCDIQVTLVSKETDFQNNYQVFTQVTDSLRKVYQ